MALNAGAKPLNSSHQKQQNLLLNNQASLALGIAIRHTRTGTVTCRKPPQNEFIITSVVPPG